MKLTARFMTDTDLFPEWPDKTMLVIGFDYSTDSVVKIESIEMPQDDWFAGKNMRDMFNVKQAIQLEKYCYEYAQSTVWEMSGENVD